MCYRSSNFEFFYFKGYDTKPSRYTYINRHDFSLSNRHRYDNIENLPVQVQLYR